MATKRTDSLPVTGITTALKEVAPLLSFSTEQQSPALSVAIDGVPYELTDPQHFHAGQSLAMAAVQDVFKRVAATDNFLADPELADDVGRATRAVIRAIVNAPEDVLAKLSGAQEFTLIIEYMRARGMEVPAIELPDGVNRPTDARPAPRRKAASA